MSAQEGEQKPLERLSVLFHQFFRHADFTSSDVAVTLYLANVLKRIQRRSAIHALLSSADHNSNRTHTSRLAGSGSSAAMQELLSHEDANAGTALVRMSTICSARMQLNGDHEGSLACSLLPYVERCASCPAMLHAHNCFRAGTAEQPHLLTASHVAHTMQVPRGVPASAVHTLYCRPGTPVAIEDVRAARRYAPFAMAAYGALYYVYLDPKPNRLCELCFARICPLWCGRWPWGTGGLSTEEDDATRKAHKQRLSNPAAVMNSDAICDVAGIARSDLKHVHSTNRFNESVPYYVALDRGSKAVVISIRGTLRFLLFTCRLTFYKLYTRKQQCMCALTCRSFATTVASSHVQCINGCGTASGSTDAVAAAVWTTR